MGYEIVIMDFASVPRLNALCALGANIHFVRGELGVDAMIKRAKQLEQSIEGSKFLDQTHSPLVRIISRSQPNTWFSS